MRSEYYLFTFESTHGAISTEKLLKPFEVRVMPVPRAISTSCGIAVRVEPERLEAALDTFREDSELAPEESSLYHIVSDRNAGLFEHELCAI